MTVFVALLRAINVGGTGMLPMKDLASLCTGLGFENVKTYIQSGNVVFRCGLAEESVRKKLEAALEDRTGKPVDVMIRTAAELRAVFEGNPFPDAEPSKVAVAFGPGKVAKGLLEDFVIPGREEVRLGKREIYIHYPDGMGRTKLKLPASAGVSTTRNINTIAKLVAMAHA